MPAMNEQHLSAQRSQIFSEWMKVKRWSLEEEKMNSEFIQFCKNRLNSKREVKP